MNAKTAYKKAYSQLRAKGHCDQPKAPASAAAAQTFDSQFTYGLDFIGWKSAAVRMDFIRRVNCYYMHKQDEGRWFWCAGTEAPRYCYSGHFIKGFKAASPAEALALAKASKGGNRYHSVVEYDRDGNMSTIYPPPRPFGEDGIPF